MKSKSLQLLLFVSFAWYKPADGIHCYQCMSIDRENPYQCQEFFPDDVDIAPKPCDEVYNAAYCIKHTGRFEGGVGTNRFCSSVDMGNYCNYISQPGDEREYRSCVYTCSSDGCNPAGVLLPTTTVVAFLCILSIFAKL